MEEGELVAHGRLTVSDYVIKEWLPSIRLRVASRTAVGYTSIMERYVLPVIGTKQLRALQPSDVEWIYRRMHNQGLSGTTQLHVHRVLFEALKAAKRRKRIAYNPCEDVDAPRKSRFEIEPPTPEEVRRLFTAADSTRIGPLVHLLVLTGMRLGEALGLRWKDVHLEEAYLEIRQTRKHRVAGLADYGAPKTERSRRSIDLAQELVDVLREHRRQQMAFYLENDFVDPNDLVFTTVDRNGVTGMTHDQVGHIWKDVRSRASVPRARIHDLRHFAATQMVSAGVSLVDVAAILGHTRPSTTSDIYSHYVKGRGKAAVGEIAKALAER
jgi:integrase